MDDRDEALMISALEDIRSHLSTAISQSIESDDQIIMNHVRTAETRAAGLLKDLRALEQVRVG